MSTRRAFLLTASIALLAGVISFGWMAVQAHEVDQARRDASVVAEKVAVASTTYRHDRFDAGVDRVLDLSTDPFARQYRSAAKTLKPLVVAAESSGTGRVVRSGVSSASGSKVVVLVFVDQRVRTGENHRVDRSRMVITVRKVGDRWLVSQLDLV